MEKVLPCRKCGSTPYFKPYEQSIDRNHDIPASVTCRTCGRSTVMDWSLWSEVVEEVGDEKYAKPTAYLSARFMDALGDATIRKWNRENGGQVMAEKGSMAAAFELTPELRDLLCLRDAEYVVKSPVEIVVEATGGIRLKPPQEIREHVVRCRDCVHYDSQKHPYGGWCSEWEGETKPDGFCHLGEES